VTASERTVAGVRPTTKKPESEEPPPDLGDLVVLAWRAYQFERLRFTDAQASALAASRADYHRAKQMIDDGCSHALACEILL
jgi:hypothetical protein